jgi:hypothetical protein
MSVIFLSEPTRAAPSISRFKNSNSEITLPLANYLRQDLSILFTGTTMLKIQCVERSFR